jgi:ABC-2 type transport system permease protein
MRLSQAWIVATKDFATFRKKKNIVYSTAVVPFLVAVLLPGVVWYVTYHGKAGGWTPATLTTFLPTFAFFYLILAGVIPATIASYSIVGEKVEKSIEPLLATPTTDGEILFGKGIAAFVPVIATILGGSTVFMVLADVVAYGRLGYYYFPNWNTVIVLFIMVPLAIVMSVEWNVLVSSRVSDIRIAQQVGGLLVLPLAGIYLAGELSLISLGDSTNLLIISAALALVDLAFLYFVRFTFRREAILTKWR